MSNLEAIIVFALCIGIMVVLMIAAGPDDGDY